MNAYSNEEYCLAPGMVLKKVQIDIVSADYWIFDHKKKRDIRIRVLFSGVGQVNFWSKPGYSVEWFGFNSYSRTYYTLPKKWADMGL